MMSSLALISCTEQKVYVLQIKDSYNVCVNIKTTIDKPFELTADIPISVIPKSEAKEESSAEKQDRPMCWNQ
jgi:hypothetical protein